jgi:hypothetical protein
MPLREGFLKGRTANFSKRRKKKSIRDKEHATGKEVRTPGFKVLRYAGKRQESENPWG